MFNVLNWQNSCEFFLIKDSNLDVIQYLHSDGNVYPTPEYWPTREIAQTVLDKYQPKHKWVHGDVFRSGCGHHLLMIYLKIGDRSKAFCLHSPISGPSSHIDVDLHNAKFLFNIKEKI